MNGVECKPASAQSYRMQARAQVMMKRLQGQRLMPLEASVPIPLVWIVKVQDQKKGVAETVQLCAALLSLMGHSKEASEFGQLEYPLCKER